jgi:glucan phosphoethanolaminetransferase (alkaline phosphatase superfamily)
MSYNQIGILLGIFTVLFILLTWKKIHNPYLRSLWKSGLLVFSLYAVILIIVEIRWYYIAEHAKSFDLNNNGFVDLNEYSDEAIEAMNRVTQDTARNYAVITVALFSCMISFAYLLADLIITRLKIKKSKSLL